MAPTDWSLLLTISMIWGASFLFMAIALEHFEPGLVTLARVVRPHTAELGQVAGTDTFRDLERNPDAYAIPGLLIYRIDDELFFANASFFVRDVKRRLVESDPPATSLVIDAEGMSDIDTTAIQELIDLVEDLHAAEITVTFARVRRPVHDMLDRSGLLDSIRDDVIFLEVDDAVQHYLSGRTDSDPET